MYRDTTNVEHEQTIIGGTKGLKKKLKVMPSKHTIDPLTKDSYT